MRVSYIHFDVLIKEFKEDLDNDLLNYLDFCLYDRIGEDPTDEMSYQIYETLNEIKNENN